MDDRLFTGHVACPPPSRNCNAGGDSRSPYASRRWSILDTTPLHAPVPPATVQILRVHVTKKISFSHMPCEAVAARLHVPASDMAEQVESAGEHGAYGFDPVLFLTTGSAKPLEECTERLGWIGACFRLNDRADPFAAHGGISQ